MKLSAPRTSLFEALQLVGRAVSTRSTLPSLGGILFVVTEGQLTLRATDMEMGLSVVVPSATPEREGTALLPGRLIVDLVRSLPEGEVVLELRTEQRDVEVRAGEGRFHLRLLPSEDFPRLPEADQAEIVLPGGPLSEAIERVGKAASRDEVRPILTGVLVQAEERTLTLVATDSYRLSVKHTELEAPVGQALEANVPARALRELARIVQAADADQVEIALPRNQAVFRAAGVTLTSRLIEGQFPSWRQLVPESFEQEVRLPREELLEVTRRVSQLAQRNAPLRLEFGEGELTVAAETPDVGDARESLPAPYSGEALVMAFNPQFLIEGIESIDAEELAFQLSSPLRPGLLRPAGREDFSYLVMPIRLNA
jgi:DNA polymerase III subunit beta